MTDNAKGISIRLLNTFLAFITAAAFVCIILISQNVHTRFKLVKSAVERFMVCQDSSKLIKESANYLTEQARLFVITHNPNYAEAYLKEKNITKGRQKALDQLKKVCTSDDLAYQRLQIAQNHSENLISIELYAIKLVYEGCKNSIKYVPEDIKNLKLRSSDQKYNSKELCNLAVDTLFGDGYLIYKKRVDENCNLTVQGIEEEITHEVKTNSDALGERLKGMRQLLTVLLILNLLTFVIYHFLVLRPLKKYKLSIERDEKLTLEGSSEFKYLAETYNAIYEIKAQNEKELIFNAEYDALTEILNRRAFEHICNKCKEENDKIALLLIDMDNFKYINDTYGHGGGDIALKTVAKLLKNTFRNNDYVCRVGGDEFAVVLRNIKAAADDAIIRKVQYINELLTDIEGGIKPVSISVGVATSDSGYKDELYNQADIALYKVKENGRRGCRIFREEMTYDDE